MNGITEFREHLSTYVLDKLGFSESTSDKLSKVSEELGIYPSESSLGFAEDYSDHLNMYFYPVRTIRSIINTKVLEYGLESLIYPAGSQSNISVKTEISYGPYRDDTCIKVRLKSKESILRSLDPMWVYKNHDLVYEFMKEDFKPYLELQKLEKEINNKYIKL